MEWLTYVTGVVAAYAAILATIEYLSRRKARQRQIRADMSFGMVGVGPEPPPVSLILTAANPGDRTVTLAGAGLLLPHRRTMPFLRPFGDVTFPHELAEGKSCTVWIDVPTVAKTLLGHGYSGMIKVRGYFEDSVGNDHYTRRLRFDVESMARRG